MSGSIPLDGKREKDGLDSLQPARKGRAARGKGQTTMIFLLLIIVIFVGMAAFLLTLAKQVSQSEYINLYTHSLLSSLLKTDTGLTDQSCRAVSDVVACSFLTPTLLCGSQDCSSLADQEVSRRVSEFAFIKEGFRFLLTVEPEGFVALPQGSPRIVEIGDRSLKGERTEKFTANERIQKSLGGASFLLNVRLTIAKKG